MVEGEKPLGGHMVAYDHGHVYDPNGYDYPYECLSIYNFKPLCAWHVDAILQERLNDVVQQRTRIAATAVAVVRR